DGDLVHELELVGEGEQLDDLRVVERLGEAAEAHRLEMCALEIRDELGELGRRQVSRPLRHRLPVAGLGAVDAPAAAAGGGRYVEVHRASSIRSARRAYVYSSAVDRAPEARSASSAGLRMVSSITAAASRASPGATSLPFTPSSTISSIP